MKNMNFKMKNKINSILLILGIIVLTSFTAVTVVTSKPATPKGVIVKCFYSVPNSRSVGDYVRNMVKKQWIVKSVSGANYDVNTSTWIVVLEKY